MCFSHVDVSVSLSHSLKINGKLSPGEDKNRPVGRVSCCELLTAHFTITRCEEPMKWPHPRGELTPTAPGPQRNRCLFSIPTGQASSSQDRAP